MDIPSLPSTPTPQPPLLHASTWQSVRASPGLMQVLWISTAFTFTIGCLDPVVPIMLKSLPGGPERYGMVMGATAIGALIGAHVTPGLKKTKTEGQIMLIGLALCTLLILTASGLVLGGIRLSVWAIAAWWAALAVCYGAMLTCLQIAIQLHAPPGQIGAVSARMQNARLYAYVIAPLAGAAAVENWGLGQGILVSAVAALIGLAGMAAGSARQAN